MTSRSRAKTELNEEVACLEPTGAAAGRPSSSSDPVVKILVLAIVVALALHTRITWSTLKRPFDSEPHAWASTHTMIIARNYSQTGILALRGLQISNNPPLGQQPDVYTHWPPLFPMLLSRIFLLWDTSEAAGRGLALAVWVGILAALYSFVKSSFTETAALGSAFALATIPAVFTFSRLVQGAGMGLLFAILALHGFMCATQGVGLNHRWAVFGAGSLLIGTLCSWEPIFLAPTLLGMSVCQRSLQGVRLAAWYIGLAIAVVASVLGAYMAAAPQMGTELWDTLLYRAVSVPHGRVGNNIHDLTTYFLHRQNLAPSELFRLYASEMRTYLGLPTLVGMALTMYVVVRHRLDRKQLLAVAGLAGLCAWWYVLLANQTVDNQFQMLLAAPLGALGAGIGIGFLAERLRNSAARIVVAIGIACWLLWPLAQYAGQEAKPPFPSGFLEYARDIRENTPTDSLVLMSPPSTVPLYYARRHGVRAIFGDVAVKLALERADDAFPGSTVYIAVEPGRAEYFGSSLRLFQAVKETPYMILLRVGVAGEGRCRQLAKQLPGDL